MIQTYSAITDNLSVGIQPPAYRLPNSARVGKAKLAVSALHRSVEFYRDIIGLAVLKQSVTAAVLGVRSTNEVLLELEALPGVRPIGKRGRLGIYHTAFLLPSRLALSSFVQHLRVKQIEFGSGDHVYSEALYLVDPDGLNVEVYADRPRSTWTFEDKELISGAYPVRFNELPAAPPESWQGVPAGTTVGHMHFYVGDLEEANDFYHKGLGLTIMTWRYPGALFTSAGGYHHHVGLNVWAAGSPVAGPTDARLIYWQLLLPDAEAVALAAASMQAAGYRPMPGEADAVLFTDPWGITLALSIERAGTAVMPAISGGLA